MEMSPLSKLPVNSLQYHDRREPMPQVTFPRLYKRLTCFYNQIQSPICPSK